jgi:hypothetical protein
MLFTLRKVDAAQRLIYARVDETPDRAGEVLDYATSKPHFERWSEEMRKASGGKSLGNLRAMHSLKAVGILQDITFDDQAKAIEFVGRVVDDEEWRKCEEGVYTGVSPGGKKHYLGRSGAYRRYTGVPNELSLVDAPCIPSATFTMMKADGAEQPVKFKERDAAAVLAADLEAVTSHDDYRSIVLSQGTAMIKALFPDDAMRAVAETHGLAKADYSSDERGEMAKSGEAEDDGSYPVKTKADLEHAIEAYGRSKDKAKTKAHIEKRAKALGATDALPEDWDGATKDMKKVVTIADLAKGMGDVGSLGSIIGQLCYLAQCVAAEASAEMDGSALPARMARWVADGASIFTDMAAEESREACEQLNALVAAIPEPMKKVAMIGDLAKAGRRNSAADLDRVQAIHDHARDLGADCGDADMAKGMGLARAAREAGRVASLETDLRKVTGERDDWRKRYVELEKRPAPGGPLLRAAERGSSRGTDGDADAEIAEIEKLPDGSEKTARLTRHAMTHPTPPRAPA